MAWCVVQNASFVWRTIIALLYYYFDLPFLPARALVGRLQLPNWPAHTGGRIPQCG